MEGKMKKLLFVVSLVLLFCLVVYCQIVRRNQSFLKTLKLNLMPFMNCIWPGRKPVKQKMQTACVHF